LRATDGLNYAAAKPSDQRKPRPAGDFRPMLPDRPPGPKD